jgi:hypothetical protein
MEALDEHRIVSHGSGRIDNGVQHLIIPGGRQTERLADGFFFRPGVLPPLPLEVEDGSVTFGELRLWRVLRLRLCSHCSPSTSSQS